MLERISKAVMYDIKKVYPDIDYFDDADLLFSLRDVYNHTHKAFIIIIDEWDCLFREYANDFDAQKKWLIMRHHICSITMRMP